MNINNVVEIIRSKGYEASIKETVKGSVKMLGIEMGTGSVRAVVYPSLEIMDDEKVAESVINTYERTDIPQFNGNDLVSPEYVRSHMFLSARRPVDDDAFALDYLDIQLVIRVAVENMGEGVGSYVIKKGHVKKLGITEKDFQLALNNMNFTVQPFSELFPMFDDVPGMYIIRTDSCLFGGAALYNKELIKALAERFDSDVVIIPSSTQELIAMKFEGKASDLESLNGMVGIVNSTQVDPMEQLSDHVYLYKKDADVILW